MGFNFRRPIIKRLRKAETDFHKFLRLHRAEFGHTFNSKKKTID